MSLISFFSLLVSIHASIGSKSNFFPNFSNYNNEIKQTTDDRKEFLLEILHGKIPFEIYKEENLTNLTYDLDFIEKINNNNKLPYTINNSSNLKNPVFDGVFLGAGVNLLNFSSTEIENNLGPMPFAPHREVLDGIIKLCNKTGDEAVDAVRKTFYFHSDQIKYFNQGIIKYIVFKKMVKAFSFKNNLHSSFYNSFISLYISMGQLNPEIYNNYDNISSLSYIIENTFENDRAPFSRLIQSKLMSLMDGEIKYNNNLILFLIPQIFDEEENEYIKNFISNFSSNAENNASENSLYISIKNISESALKYDVYFNNDIGELFEEKNKSSNTEINLDNAYLNIINFFSENGKSDLYKNQIVVFFSTYEANYTSQDFQNANSVIDKLQKEKSIQTIPIIIVKNKSDTTDKMKYNILTDLSNIDVDVRKTLLAISNMHNYIYLPYNKSIENIVNSDLDTPVFFELYFEESKTYTIEFKFNDNINYKYNIFASDINPYPSIKNHTEKILVYYNNTTPKLKIESKKSSSFYISVECIGKFNLLITENNESIDNSVYNFEEKPYNCSSNFVSIAERKAITDNFFTSDKDYKLKNIFPNDWTIETFLKYSIRGTDRFNSENNDFFDRNLFIYLFNDLSLINRVYSFGGQDFYFGRNLSLSDFTPLMLKNESLDQLTINKLYYFLQNSTIIYNSSLAPSVYFDDEEIIKIFNITHKRYLDILINALSRETDTFDQQNTHLKFIMYCMYFMSPNDKLITKRIRSLGSPSKETYIEIINYLIDLYNSITNSNLNKVLKFLVAWLQHLIQHKTINVNEKALVSLVVGKSFILDDYGYNFIINFITTINKRVTKFALSAYDTLNNKIENVIPIFKNPSNRERMNLINDYRKLYDESTKKLYNGTQNMNLNQILDYSLNEFKRFDTGIKKLLIIVTDENCLTEKKYYINNKLTGLNYDKHSDLIDNEIYLIVATTKNYEKGEIPELFTLDSSGKIPYTIEENYFHYENITIYSYMDGFSHILTQSIIPININKKIITDVYEDSITYYKVCNIKDNSTVNIKVNDDAFNVYFSKYFPFPKYKVFDGDINFQKDENLYIVTLDSSYNGSFFISFEAKKKNEKQIIEIFSCEDNNSGNCDFKNTPRIQWVIFVIVVLCFILGLVIYNWKYSYSFGQKIFNIFER